ncbi:outer membrane beta-barrel protein [Flammeovirgaceae bacterium SG7u.111]|nr:outer membrane beta-barrel protein [Flammeovirgaceae bacterium SG7u.132]WPO36803.1 outer membrane beta-barrel protein [Flammeovirgaceae bacterium SG7u.111]
MQRINFWNKLYLHWQKIAVFALLATLSTGAFAQEATNIRLLDFDKKKIHYGFQLGLFTTNLNVKHSQHFVDGLDSTVAVIPNRTYSFSLGFVVNFALQDELWDLRLLPNVSFYNHSVTFDYPESSKTELIEKPTTFLELPVLLKYTSIRRKNHRFYLLGGFTGGIGVGGKKGAEGTESLSLNNMLLDVTYGVGLSGYMQLFHFAPEIRFSHGLINMHSPQDNIFSNNIDRITTHKVSFILNFEG